MAGGMEAYALLTSASALRASGEFTRPCDSTVIVIPPAPNMAVSFFINYDPNNSATAPKIKVGVEWSPDRYAWYMSTVADAGTLTAGSDMTIPLQRAYRQYDTTQDDNADQYLLLVRAVAPFCRIRAAESGDTANPGAVTIQYAVGPWA